MSVRVRGVYATALTALLADECGVTRPSDPIAERFDASFGDEPPAVRVDTSENRLGVGASGDPATVSAVVARLADVATDVLAWTDPRPAGAVARGVVTDTLGGGAVVTLGDGGPDLAGEASEGTATDGADAGEDSLPALAGVPAEGYLPYDAVDERVETGDELTVQVREPAAPWADRRPELDAEIRIDGDFGRLVRRAGASGNGSDASGGVATGGPQLTDVLPTDPPEGWVIDWAPRSEDRDLDALDAALSALGDRAEALDEQLAGGDAEAPAWLATDGATAWVRFGREARMALDGVRREVTTTMPGHHRIKAGDRAASAAVDFAEAVAGEGLSDREFPFAVVSRQFGPRTGDRVRIAHGKPDGRSFDLGRATVTDVQGDCTVTLERELSGGGTYDGLGVERQAGDVATTTVREGRWWYPTVYESADGEPRGTYVNVCTPVEVFPDAVSYVDLHVDVLRHADGSVDVVDRDELADAVEAGHVSEDLAEEARTVAEAVADGLS